MSRLKSFYPVTAIALICLHAEAFAQPTFQKDYTSGYSSHPRQILTMRDGWPVMCGILYNGGGNTNPYLLKTNENGIMQWDILMSDVSGTFESMDITSDNGVIATGYSRNAFTNDCLLAKMDSAGHIEWAKAFDPGYHDHSGTSVKQVLNGHYIVTGIGDTIMPSGQVHYIFLLDVDSAGNILLNRMYYGNGNPIQCGAIQTRDRNYILYGLTALSATDSAVFIVKMDSAGNVLWSRNYGDSVFSYPLADLKEFVNGELLLLAHGYNESFLVRLDNQGAVKWSRSYNRTFSTFYLAGDTALVIATWNGITKTDSSGHVLWSKDYMTQLSVMYPHGVSVSQAAGGFYFLGLVWWFTNCARFLLIKTDTEGGNCSEANLSTSETAVNLNVDSVAWASAYLPLSILSPSLSVQHPTFSTVECAGTGIQSHMTQGQPRWNPNPFNRHLVFDLPVSTGKMNLSVFHSTGTLIYQTKISEDDRQVELPDFTPGLYFFRVYDDKNIFSSVLIKTGE